VPRGVSCVDGRLATARPAMDRPRLSRSMPVAVAGARRQTSTQTPAVAGAGAQANEQAVYQATLLQVTEPRM